VYSAGQRGAISGPIYFWRNKFEELTGATYDIVEIPFAELREKIFTDLQTGAGRYDVIINCSNYYGDYIANDWILPLDKYFNDPRMPKWDRDSIATPVANLMKWRPLVRHQQRPRRAGALLPQGHHRIAQVAGRFQEGKRP